MAADPSTENNSAADQKCTGASCYHCLEKLESKSHLALLVNVIEVHENAKHFKCLDCNQTLTNRKSFLTHRKSHLVCQICGKKCRFPLDLKEHIRIHTGERPHECEFCQKRFRTPYCLRVHIRTHINDKQHECEFCQKLFRTSYILQTHIRIHTGERPYECESCQKSFAQRSSLERHRKIHSRSKSFTCNECGKSFSEYGNLSRHINRTHKDEPTNKDCNETLKSRSEYLEHLKCHVKCCPSCGKVFATPYNLQSHIHSHDASSQNEAITDKKLGLKPVVVLNRIDTDVSN